MPKDNVTKILSRKVKAPKKVKPPKVKPLKFKDLVSTKRPRKRPSKPLFYGHLPKLVLALSMANALDAKETILGKKYRHYTIRQTSRKLGSKLPKVHPVVGSIYSSFASHVGFNLIKHFIGTHGKDGQKGLAAYNVGATRIDKYFGGQKLWGRAPQMKLYYKNKSVFQTIHGESTDYLDFYSQYGRPKLHPVYFWAIHGRTKLRKLSEDTLYRKLKKLQKYSKTPADYKRIKRLLEKRKKQFNVFVAEVEYKKYLQSTYKPDSRRGASLEVKIADLYHPDETPFKNYIGRDLHMAHQKKMILERAKIFEEMHNFLEGEELQEYLAKSVDERPYRALIQGIITCLRNDELLDIDSTNKGALRKSNKALYELSNNAELRREFEAYARRNQTPQNGSELQFDYLYKQFGDPAKTSRSGTTNLRYQHKAGRSQGKYIRIFPTKYSNFPGIDIEQKEATEFAEKYDEKAKRAFKAIGEVKEEIKTDYQQYLQSKPLEELLDEVIEIRKQANKNVKRVTKK